MQSSKFLAGTRAALPAILLAIILAPALQSCDNSEGLGGTASISGSLTEVFFNEDFSEELYRQAAADEEVFILFGNAREPGDRVNTGLNGDFRFKYLYPGTYHIYYRSDDSTEVPDDGWSEVLTVELAGGEDKALGELFTLNTLDFDDGHATISGTVKKIKYSKDSFWPNLVVDYVDFAHDHEVYLVYGDGAGYDERVRTSHDGSFAFRNLIPGEYKIFLYSEDVSKETEHVILSEEVSITTLDQHVVLEEFVIEEK